MSKALAVLLTLFAFNAAAQMTVEKRPPKKLPLLSAPELLKRLEESPITFKILTSDTAEEDPETFSDRMWPARRQVESRTRVRVTESGQRVVEELPVAAVTKKQMDAAEALFQKQKFPEAMAIYKKVSEANPDYYVPHLYMGDCAYGLKKYEEAVGHYRKAVELNPADYQTHFFLGDALFETKRYAEAVESYTDALVARPNYPTLMKVLVQKARLLRATVNDEPFESQGVVRRVDEKTVEVVVASEAPSVASWMGYTMCKAYWRTDPKRREEMGVTGQGWSSLEERECLAILLSIYLSQREDGKAKRDPALDRLVETVKPGLFDAFVLYEIGARMDPYITATLPTEIRAQVRQYVQQFILVPWTEEPATAEAGE